MLSPRKTSNVSSQSKAIKDCRKRVRSTTLNAAHRLNGSRRIWTLLVIGIVVVIFMMSLLQWNWNLNIVVGLNDNAVDDHIVDVDNGDVGALSLVQGTNGVLDTPYGHPAVKDMPNPCIVILTYNRPQSLLRTVDSLKSVPGAWHPSRYQIYISQDGDHRATTDMIRDTINAVPFDEAAASSSSSWNGNITSIKHLHHPQGGGTREPTQKLAVHYKFMFDVVFNTVGHSHAIILEDDMIFSADFLEYFASTVYLLNNAANHLFCVSSWNDYGQKFLDHDATKIRRTDYFPGLGWLLKRSLWTQDIGHIFPGDHWDHFMRTDVVTKGRDCLYPEVSRNYNVGEHGSTMDGRWYDLYLKPMRFEAESRVRFRDLDLSYLEQDRYEAAMVELFRAKARFVGVWPADSDLIARQLREPSTEYGRYLLIPYHGFEWNHIAQRVGLLDTQRTRHRDTIVIGKNGVHYIFANIRLSPYLQHNAETVDIAKSIRRKDMVIVAGDTGTSCDAVCAQRKMQCLGDAFEYVNSCSALREQFECEGGCLGGQIGEDVPNYVAARKPGLYQKCLTTDFTPSCRASHRTTRRICPCA